ncbi:Rrf2 family transcriptional regulator [Gammaproteobacteria bacterium AB-CW1]|uniref:Rrf2 family transcriptional regulator n=1 Tax=Natronospira elongata TaxID=3110268 RepID=A0AAP6JJ49_9GAMM|nr:Rrf2 family transcriptional regulator [Gammaproteobacteria bacterium AB-CW1]
MHLTRHTDYAYRVLIYLAIRPGEQATINEIAEAYGISRNHLMKVVQGLARAGFLLSRRGKGGGIRLARPTAEINLGAVAREMEEDFAIAECFPGGAGQCNIVPACRLMHVLDEALREFMRVLDGYTLDDLMGQREALAGLLQS